ncbi:MAG: DUF2207 domain-containing protein [Candidatus Saccharimonadaceae bacterium]|nr:DUF2207 domain-containing protein [Candidatus Saccharimonadaceae bacterium]
MKYKIPLGLVVLLAFLLSIICPNLTYATVNDFVIKDFQADYYLDKDSEGRSTLKTVERITAEFPQYDQNHGIERAIPLTYDGHGVRLRVESVQGEDEQNLNFTNYESNGNIVLRIGDADTYVHGLKTYVITYYQHDVTRYFSDTKDDEFYWDTNGTGWSQVFEKVTVRLHLSSNIVNSLNSDMACYYGVSGSNDGCRIERTDDVISANQSNLKAGENLTIAVGFKAGTFHQYVLPDDATNDSDYIINKQIVEPKPVSFFQKYFAIGETIIGIITFVVICYIRIVKFKSAPSTHAIVPEYLPPRDADVALSSVISGRTRAWVAATYVDLAVRHKIKIVETGEKKWWSKQKYNLEFVSNNGLTVTEESFIEALFGKNPSKGAIYEMNPNSPDYKLNTKLRDIYRKSVVSANEQGFYIVNGKYKFLAIALTVYLFIQFFSLFFLFSETGTLFFGEAIILNFLTMLISIIIVSTMKPLSTKGRELYDYLKGLELYIKIGEEQRLKVLQSPEGAEKTPVDVNDKTKLVHLYERVLPYAVLFGQEKGWTKALGEYYEQQNTQPDWYVGHAGFNAVIFSSMMSDFSSGAARSSYSAPSSSSSGGSSGGGFSGGGGGGGGGGGW